MREWSLVDIVGEVIEGIVEFIGEIIEGIFG
jgi:hypothetical protein